VVLGVGAGGRAALAGSGRAGRARRLSRAQLAEVQVALVKGPRANGAKAADLLVLGNGEAEQAASELAPTIRDCIRRADCHLVVNGS
jgi:hypothetical protein